MSLFADIKQIQSWKRIKSSLLKAKSFVAIQKLDNNQLGKLKDFDEYIDHNELGLAFEQLELLAETIIFPSDFWKEMLSAANEMKPYEKSQNIQRILNQ